MYLVLYRECQDKSRQVGRAGQVESSETRQSDRDLLFCYCETFAVWMDSVRAGKLNVPMLTQVRQMLNEMGMTPAARTRIVVDKPVEQSDGKARFFG